MIAVEAEEQLKQKREERALDEYAERWDGKAKDTRLYLELLNSRPGIFDELSKPRIWD